MITFFRWLLFPLSLLYGIGVWIRNKLYDWHILKTKSYPIKTIVVGNLAVGGSGKSPMTEYLIRVFWQEYRLATLSRGYGRKTKGFLEVNVTNDVSQVGDEPLQFKRKFPSITVTVCEDRRKGIEQLMSYHDLIILDDAFQHRRIRGKVNILLFEYSSLLHPVIPLPTGNFRDLMNQIKRAEIIVITKCPKEIPQTEKAIIERKILKYGKRPIFYSYINYGQAIHAIDTSILPQLKDYSILLITGIANPTPLKQYLIQQATKVISIEFPDHHHFSDRDYQNISRHFNQMNAPNKIVLTTTKDLQRMDLNRFQDIPLYHLPISTAFYEEDSFQRSVKQALT